MDPAPTLDLAALEAAIQASHLPDTCSACDRYEELAVTMFPALVARVRALEAEVAALKARIREYKGWG